MPWGNTPKRGPEPAVALTGLLMALRRYLRTRTTGDLERLETALRTLDGDN